MTDDELRTELISRGLSAAGNRETMKETLFYGDESIPISDYITSRYTLTFVEIIKVSSLSHINISCYKNKPVNEIYHLQHTRAATESLISAFACAHNVERMIKFHFLFIQASR